MRSHKIENVHLQSVYLNARVTQDFHHDCLH